jgi:hypothetical protein
VACGEPRDGDRACGSLGRLTPPRLLHGSDDPPSLSLAAGTLRAAPSGAHHRDARRCAPEEPGPRRATWRRTAEGDRIRP